MNKSQPSYYMNIPAYVWDDDDLKKKPNSIILYGHISTLANQKGYCWATNDYFMEKLGVQSKKTVIEYINLLVKKGFIRRKVFYKKGTKQVEKRVLSIDVRNQITPSVIDDTTPSVVSNTTPSVVSNTTPSVMNYTDNNTSKNNIKTNNTRTNNTTNASLDEISSVESPNNQDKVLGCGSVYEFYEKNIGMTSPYIREDIQYEFDDWMQINESEASQIIIEALKIAVEAQASNKWRYAKSILKSWEEKNIKSLKDIEADDAQHRRKMDSRFNARKPREEKMPDWVNEQPQDEQQEASPEDMAEIQRLFDKINQNDEED